jgi:hypothetical protein
MTEKANDWLNAHDEESRAIRFLVEETDLSPNQAREIVEKHGFNRAELLRVAQTLKAEG